MIHSARVPTNASLRHGEFGGLRTAPMHMDRSALDAIVENMLSPDNFFTAYWAKQPVHIPGAGVCCVGRYGVDEFLADMTAAQPPPYLVIGAKEGARVYSHPEAAAELCAAVETGGVAPMRISRHWHHSNAPDNWVWMRALFGGLCRAVSMIYMSPPRSENVDLFLAGPRSQLGVHYDTSHTFTLQLFGERKWVVEDCVHLEERLASARDPDFCPNKEVELQGPTREVTLRPGDALYVPAYATHSVTGVGWSVSLGLGFRAFNEVDFVGHVLEIFERTRYMDFSPAPSLPESTGDLHVEAKLELVRRIRALLRQLEMTAVGSVMVPLRLPDTLAPLKSPPSDGSVSG